MHGSRPKTAFVLAGGGSYGAVQVGMLRALAAHGVVPDLVTGSSVGAINGAFFAGRPDPDGTRELEQLWHQLRRSDIFSIGLRGLRAAFAGGNSFFEPLGLRRLLQKHLPYERLEESAIPIYVVATDLLTGGQVHLRRGAAVDAILASCAIPGIYPPVHIDGRALIDGAVACNTPIRTAIDAGATRLVLLPTAFACPRATPPRGVFANAFHAMDLMVMQQLVHETAEFAARAQIVTVPPICPVAASPYDFSNARRLIDLAATSTERWLERNGLGDGGPMPAASAAAMDDGSCGAELPTCPSDDPAFARSTSL